MTTTWKTAVTAMVAERVALQAQVNLEKTKEEVEEYGRLILTITEGSKVWQIREETAPVTPAEHGNVMTTMSHLHTILGNFLTRQADVNSTIGRFVESTAISNEEAVKLAENFRLALQQTADAKNRLENLEKESKAKISEYGQVRLIQV